MLKTNIFSYSHNVFNLSQNKSQFFGHIYLSSANAFNLDKSKILSFGKELKTFTTQQKVYISQNWGHLQTHWINWSSYDITAVWISRKHCLTKLIFIFIQATATKPSHIVQKWTILKDWSPKDASNLTKRLLMYCFLTLSQMTNFRLFQTERACRRQFWVYCKWRKLLRKGRKHCGNRRKCLFRAISPFLKVFSKDLHCRHVKTRAFLGKG